ncbi:MAG: SpoIIE family protein phosphatase [Kineosporiaceae bacterium]|nr:SpoIIE family protein phosphatase [Kineosporiaceae bacterium]
MALQNPLALGGTGTIQELPRLDRHLATSQRTARMGSWHQDLATGQVDWSDQMFLLLGVEPEPATAGTETLLSRLHPDDAPVLRGELARLEAAEGVSGAGAGHGVGAGGVVVRVRVGSPGAAKVLEVRARVEVDPAGRRQTLGTLQDVTQLVALERDLHAGAERFRVVFDAAPIGMALVDDRLHHRPVIVMANRALARLAGIEVVDLVGLGLDRVAPGIDLSCAGPVEVRLVRPDGAPCWVSVSAASIGDHVGARRHLVVHWVDVTERRLAQAEVRGSDDRAARIAAVLQNSLLPYVPQRVGPVVVATRYRACGPGERVGGDWSDVFALPGGRIGIVVGDVAGHGIEAAATMTRLRALVRMLATSGASPAGVLRRLNDVMQDGDLGLDIELATLVHGQLDPRTGLLTHSSAGHLPLIALPPGEGDLPRVACPIPAVGGPPIGAVPGFTYTQQVLGLEPGTTAIGYSDGLIERRGQDLSLALLSLVEALNSLPPELAADAEALADHLLVLGDAEHCEDDVAVIVLGFEPQAWPSPRGT